MLGQQSRYILSLISEDCNQPSNGQRIAGLGNFLKQHPIVVGFHIHGGLVGLHLCDHIAGGNFISFFHGPFHQDTFFHGVRHFWHIYCNRHLSVHVEKKRMLVKIHHLATGTIDILCAG